MSDSIKGFTITLEKDISEEQASRLESAIGLLPGVISVDRHVASGADLTKFLEVSRMKYDLIETLIKKIRER